MDIDYKKISRNLKIGLSTLYQWEKTRPDSLSPNTGRICLRKKPFFVRTVWSNCNGSISSYAQKIDLSLREFASMVASDHNVNVLIPK